MQRPAESGHLPNTKAIFDMVWPPCLGEYAGTLTSLCGIRNGPATEPDPMQLPNGESSMRHPAGLRIPFWKGRRSFLRSFCFGLLVLSPSLAHAASLENPSNNLFYSGIGVISGWKCEANGELTVRFNGGEPISLVYGSERPDVLEVRACASADVGFVAIWNWANLGDGTHTAVVYDNGVEFARSTFKVATLGLGPFVPGLSGRFRARDFPDPGVNVLLRWNQNVQGFVIEGVEE